MMALNLIESLIKYYYTKHQNTPPNSGVFLFLNINKIIIHIQKEKFWIYYLNRMNCTKLLNELMMKNGPSVKLNKKYFLAIHSLLGIQLGLGINFAYAVTCEPEIIAHMKLTMENYTGPKLNSFDYDIYFMGLNHIYYKNPNDFWPSVKNRIEELRSNPGSESWPTKEMLEINIKRAKGFIKDYGNYGNANLVICYSQKLLDANGDVDAIINGKAANKFSSYGSSSQSNKKANQQSANNQSSSSNLSEQSKKKINEAVDQGNNAHDNKDYAKSIDAIKIILANSSNITLKGEATNRLAEYYKYGHGVPKDEVNAQALFEQASIAGNPDANAHIGQNYEDGTGGVIKNHQTAIKYFSAAASKGHLVAMSKLGYLYHAGIGTINPELGNEWICKAAKQGSSTAIGNAEKLKLNCN